jgi:hypothetical protein
MSVYDLSHYPEIRKDIEERLVRRYERWVWLLALLTGLRPENMVQYYQDKLAGFIIDLEISPDNISMPSII